MSEDFVVHDKRLFTKDGQVKSEPADDPGPEKGPAGENARPSGPEARPETGPDQSLGALPPANFAGLLVGLATSAFIHLGESPEGAADGPGAAPDLPAAKHAIDLLAVLQTKTQGNLTQEEDSLLTTLLYDLRLKFVEACSDK